MPDSNHLPEHLRARLARGLDAVPELRPLPEQATYAQAGRRRPGRRRLGRGPAAALASGAGAAIALALVAGLASSGSANPVDWTGRALLAIRQDGPPAAAPPPAVQAPAPERPRPSLQPRPPAPTARPPLWPVGWAQWGRLPVRPEASPETAPRLTPPPLPTPFPFPTPSGASDFGRGGR